MGICKQALISYALIIPPHSKATSLDLIYKSAKTDVANSVKYLGIHLNDKSNFKTYIEMQSWALGTLRVTTISVPVLC